MYVYTNITNICMSICIYFPVEPHLKQDLILLISVVTAVVLSVFSTIIIWSVFIYVCCIKKMKKAITDLKKKEKNIYEAVDEQLKYKGVAMAYSPAYKEIVLRKT